MWTPELAQEMARKEAMQQLDELEEIGENPDNIRHYNPKAQGFTQAEQEQVRR